MGLAWVLAAATTVVIFMTALAADTRLDVQRTMFSDARHMAKLQEGNIKHHGGHGSPADVQPGQTITIDRHLFTSSDGNSVKVTVTSSGYCIRVFNPIAPGTPAVFDSVERNEDPFALTPGGACG